MRLESETQGNAGKLRHKRARLRISLARTYRYWFTWGMHMPNDPDWSQGGMVWKRKGNIGIHYVGHS